ncbi:MAG: sigma-70 family RNA polymerase sigma factor [Chloroflexota bacterium]|nr:sigma-70 family RNA polymerase sigma factor [Chloroflexota bacterium]MDE3192552.1 sigma-70 family RNA polymerase sigma factor [Chloroflexota bacterium]
MEAETAYAGRLRAVTSAPLPAGFERLFLREYARVAAIAFRVLGDRDEAEDVAQDAFLSFYRRQDPAASYAAPWLHRAAAHLALNAARGGKRRERREAAVGRESDRAVDPEEEAILAERRAEVRAALARLPRESASLLALRYSGLSYAEVASALDIKADQVGTRLRRAQEAFKKEVLDGPAR